MVSSVYCVRRNTPTQKMKRTGKNFKNRQERTFLRAVNCIEQGKKARKGQKD